MSLPAISPAALCEDPFGFWEYAPETPAETGMLSFGDGSVGGEPDVLKWRLDLVSGSPSSGKAELDRRAEKLAAIETGLERAEPRLDTFLARRKRPSGTVSFGLEGTQADLPAPEAELAFALAVLEQSASTQGAVNFGIGETVAQVAGAVGIDWNGLQAQFNALIEGVNRQLLHAAWIETNLDGRLVARTTLTWGGDLTTCMALGLEPGMVRSHQASLEQAVASESANLKTVLTVAQLAGKIALAATTPLGAAQALALGWQFVKTVISKQ